LGGKPEGKKKQVWVNRLLQMNLRRGPEGKKKKKKHGGGTKTRSKKKGGECALGKLEKETFTNVRPQARSQ